MESWESYVTRKTRGANEPKESTSCMFSAVCLCIKFCLSFWRLRTFARKFSNIDFFLKILPLKDDESVMSEM